MSNEDTGLHEPERDDSDTSEGAGPEGTIPASETGVAAGATDEPSQFEPEEDDGGDSA
ncbi:hypothetical protein GM708_08670 [Vibrio cholerae]|nr:hypothetical protein [Vibrio cholerae]